ncbi:hypothetical protein EDD85DRAFT_1004446 [Armillaria nabsnona]|nr:hypothetical protein EDD85DRAFT_1004446 [Armillaria nabsnona]
MTTPQANRISLPHRSFGVDESALDDENDTPQRDGSSLRRVLGRISFGNSMRRPSFASRLRAGADSPAPSERPPVPTVMQPAGEVYQTPLPILSMIVLSITMLGEFLSANVSTPFLLFMVKGQSDPVCFGVLTDEAEIAFWTGVLVSTFFLTQFLTSLLWATVADKHGRRAVLVISLLGSALTCAIFGTCTTLQQAICVRLLQGIFAGAVGVARGSISFVTDASNEGRAYAILGFCWGFGGVAGAIIGGTFESPALKWPGTFDSFPLFVNYPYLLPCAMAAAITFTGSVLACFLGPDGGPREGAIRLMPEKVDMHPPIPEEESIPPSPIFDDEDQQPTTLTGSMRKKLSQKLSGYFASRVYDAQDRPNSGSSVTPQPPVPLAAGPKLRTASRTSRINGSAYGYGSYRNRLASNATTTVRAKHGSMASSLRRRRGSNLDGHRELQASESNDLNFAQRLLMANENAVTNIADLWVAAAMNVDNEDPFESDTEMGSDEDFGEEALDAEENAEHVLVDDDAISASVISTPARRSRRASSNVTPIARRSSNARGSIRPLRLGSPRLPSSPWPIPERQASFSQPLEGTHISRRFSNAPSIFSHPGVKTPAAVLDAQQLLAADAETAAADSLAPIAESRRVSQIDGQVDVESLAEKPASLSSQLPIMIIVQYGLLALHSTTHDQVFMSYLVTDYDSGGLNLNAGHFAQLIALMCLCQIAYQFYLYPNIGPPRGRFSHLAMFRLGSLLFIPSYLTVVLYRVPFASEENDGNFILMTGLAISTALRFCGSTFAYTAVSILLNYMTPPNAVGYANGIAQSIVSLARCLGPVLGGYLWSVSIEGNPNGYPLGFIACAGACALALLHSMLIR